MNVGLVMRCGFRLVVLMVLAFAPGHAFGTIVIQDEVPGTPYTAATISALVGGGLAQTGLSVTVKYTGAGGFEETVLWVADAGPSLIKGSATSGLFSGGWTMSADADPAGDTTFGDPAEDLTPTMISTKNEPWKFLHDAGKLPTGVVLESITLDGSLANIVFDRPVLDGMLVMTPYNPMGPIEGADSTSPTVGDSGEFGTTDSARGRDFYSAELDTGGNDVEVTYSNQVGTFGDLFTKVVLFFPDDLAPGVGFNFAIDTDQTTGLTAVPEPSAFLFGGLVCGVIGLAAGYRRWGTKVCAEKSE